VTSFLNQQPETHAPLNERTAGVIKTRIGYSASNGPDNARRAMFFMRRDYLAGGMVGHPYCDQIGPISPNEPDAVSIL
jgi:hypothetical protein